MLSSLVITLREGIEGALAIAIVLLYLRKTGRHQMVPAVWWGLAAALLCSGVGAVLFHVLTFNNEIVEGVLMLLAAFFVGTMILWMWRSAKSLKKEIERRVESITSAETPDRTGQKLGIFFFTFLMILREGIETVIFLSAVSFTTDALLNFLGGIAGLAMAVAFGIFFVRGSIRIDLGRFFKITGIVLLLFVFQLVIGGIHELGEGGLFDIGPREMSIVGPIVKNNALFLIGILLIPVLMLLIPRSKSDASPQLQSAERRLLLAEQRKQTVWRFTAATLSVVIILFIAFDFVYGQNKKRLSTPAPVTAVNGEIRIPIAEVSDGDLHRFILSGTRIRLLAMKLDDQTMGIVFDACEICGSQGYIQESGAVICLNCDADINPATFKKGGGCNPIPLPSRVEGDHIVIRVEDLKQQEKIF